MLQAELINYLPTEQDVYLQVDMEYVNGRVGGDVIGSGLAAPACTMTTGWRPEKNTSGKIEGDGYKVVKDGYIISARECLTGTETKLIIKGRIFMMVARPSVYFTTTSYIARRMQSTAANRES
jgi:hypothetical protein